MVTRVRRTGLFPAIALLSLVGGPMAAQQPKQQSGVPGHQVRWSDAALAVGGVGLLMLADEPLREFVQEHRSSTSDDIAGIFRTGGEVPIYAGVSLGVLGVGLVSGKAGVRRAGMRLVTSVALSSGEMWMMKRLVGRSRPTEEVGAFSFHPFTSLKDSTGLDLRHSMPSGHVTAAFAVATSLADDIKKPGVSVLLYTLASGTAFSRINDDRHWLSDTAMGAVLGIFTAKVVNGQWRIFGLRSPRFLVEPEGALGLGWETSF